MITLKDVDAWLSNLVLEIFEFQKLISTENEQRENRKQNLLAEFISNFRVKEAQREKFDNTGNEIISQTSIIKEIKVMQIKLNIGGSPRIRENGLLEVRSTKYGSTYGRTVEELEAKLIKKIKAEKSHCKSKKQKTVIPLLSEFFENTYIQFKADSLQLNSINSIRYDFKWIIAGLTDKKLNVYSSEEIESFLLSVIKTRKRQLLRGTLNNIFTYAAQLKVIAVNPMDSVSKVAHKSKQGRALAFCDQEIFFDNLFNSNLSDTLKLFLTFVYLTGTRRSEALSIKLSDVNLNGNVLHIPGTKTEKSDRYCPLHPLAKKIVQLCKPDKDGKLFSMAKDLPTHAIGKVIEGYRLHDLRHTFGTIAICVQKLDQKTVALYMGHSSVNMTLNTYTHPKQLDIATFFNGNLDEMQKLSVLRDSYKRVLEKIENYLDRTQSIPKNR